MPAPPLQLSVEAPSSEEALDNPHTVEAMGDDTASMVL